ncbi:hypothetical protein RclHR1_19250002 [Rhizophagus clarus]|uniref:Uncharacterized protein n=1 Tax=Rhizophagus clarus TaxID=94130 RepID=A0A2Z6R2I7_9GLOM|nr:hypothetical protein RclHR1_19250002 [Rhizophagus clarus]GES95340.1 hypothetical protein GLOIN_2v1782020 [Rhizophagus clarus]
MSNYLDQIDCKDLCSSPKVNEQVQKLVNKARDGAISQQLTGKELLKICLRSDTKQRDIVDIDIDSAANEIWNSRLTTSQKEMFTSLAENINKIRNEINIELIARINTPQTTKTAIVNDFYNGTSFLGDTSIESSVLPLGWIYGGPFQ